MESKKISFGKYKDITYAELVKTDPEYALWVTSILKDEKAKEYVLANLPPPRPIGKFRINFGKYATETYDWLLENDPLYAKWLVDKVRSKKIRAYLREKLSLEQDATDSSDRSPEPDLSVHSTTTTCSTL